MPSERTPHSSEVAIGSAVPSPSLSAVSPLRLFAPFEPEHFLHGAADHVLVGEPGQLEAAAAGVDHARLWSQTKKAALGAG